MSESRNMGFNSAPQVNRILMEIDELRHEVSDEEFVIEMEGLERYIRRQKEAVVKEPGE